MASVHYPAGWVCVPEPVPGTISAPTVTTTLHEPAAAHPSAWELVVIGCTAAGLSLSALATAAAARWSPGVAYSTVVLGWVWVAALATVPCLNPAAPSCVATLLARWYTAAPLRTATVTLAGLTPAAFGAALWWWGPAGAV